MVGAYFIGNYTSHTQRPDNCISQKRHILHRWRNHYIYNGNLFGRLERRLPRLAQCRRERARYSFCIPRSAFFMYNSVYTSGFARYCVSCISVGLAAVRRRARNDFDIIAVSHRHRYYIPSLQLLFHQLYDRRYTHFVYYPDFNSDCGVPDRLPRRTYTVQHC